MLDDETYYTVSRDDTFKTPVQITQIALFDANPPRYREHWWQFWRKKGSSLIAVFDFTDQEDYRRLAAADLKPETKTGD